MKNQIKNVIFLVILAACGKEADLAKMADGANAKPYRACDAFTGTYTAQDGVQKLKAKDCQLLYRAPAVGNNIEFDATFSATSETAGWLFIEVYRSEGFADPKEGSRQCSFSYNKGTLALNCTDGMLRQKFYRDLETQ